MRLTFAVALLCTTPLHAVVSVGITIDGAFEDWSPVLADTQNAVGDTVAPNDPDSPNPAQNRDLHVAGYTWDTTNLSVYSRRTSVGINALEYRTYIDRDCNGVLESTDMVLVLAFKGAAYQASQSGLYWYAPLPPGTADVIGGDGSAMPGSLGTAVMGATCKGAGGATGIEIEGSVPWTSLALPAGSPLILKFAITQGGSSDNSGARNTAVRGITLVANQTASGVASQTTTYLHTLTNTGNATETVDLSSASSLGWGTEIRANPGTAPTSSVSVAPGASVALAVLVKVPSDAANGARDVTTLRAALRSSPSVSATVRDTTLVGPVLVIPDLEGSTAPSSTIRYRYTVTNNSDAMRTVNLVAQSAQGWRTSILASDGATPLLTLTLAPKQSAIVLLDIEVPNGTSLGVVDVTTLRAEDVADSSARGQGKATTCVRKALDIEADSTIAANPGSYAWFTHTVVNSWPDTRTISLSSVNSSSWPCALFNDGRNARITSVTVGPFGGTAIVSVRVSVPATATEGLVTTTTVTAAAGAHSDTVCDVTVARKLTTYSDNGYAVRSSFFRTGATVYARAGGLNAGDSVTMRWVDASSTAVFTSAALTVDTLGNAICAYSVPASGPVGVWTIVLLDNGGAELARTTFTVAHNASILALSATDALSSPSTFTVSSQIENRSSVEITGTRLDCLVWWDSDSNGSFNAGDLYADTTGQATTYTAGTVYSRRDTGVAVASGALRMTSFDMSNLGLARSGIWNVRLDWAASNGALIDTRSTSFRSVKSSLSVTVSPGSASLGDVYPADVAVFSVNVIVDADGSFDLTTSLVNPAALGLASSLGSRLAQLPGRVGYSDSVSIVVPWSSPGPVSSSVVYTVVPR